MAPIKYQPMPTDDNKTLTCTPFSPSAQLDTWRPVNFSEIFKPGIRLPDPPLAPWDNWSRRQEDDIRLNMDDKYSSDSSREYHRPNDEFERNHQNRRLSNESDIVFKPLRDSEIYSLCCSLFLALHFVGEEMHFFIEEMEANLNSIN